MYIDRSSLRYFSLFLINCNETNLFENSIRIFFKDSFINLSNDFFRNLLKEPLKKYLQIFKYLQRSLQNFIHHTSLYRFNIFITEIPSKILSKIPSYFFKNSFINLFNYAFRNLFQKPLRNLLKDSIYLFLGFFQKSYWRFFQNFHQRCLWKSLRKILRNLFKDSIYLYLGFTQKSFQRFVQTFFFKDSFQKSLQGFNLFIPGILSEIFSKILSDFFWKIPTDISQKIPLDIFSKIPSEISSKIQYIITGIHSEIFSKFVQKFLQKSPQKFH